MLELPEWITHVAFAYAAALLLGWKRRSLAVTGSLLPDLVQKLAFPASLAIGAGTANAVFGIGHTPVFSFFVSLAIACLLPLRLTDSLAELSLGWAGHYALDMLQGPGGQQLLWPFSQQQFGFFLWYSDSWTPFAVTLTLLAAYAVWKTVGERGRGRR